MRQILIVSAGNFWEAEDFFAQIPGVVHTTVGYTGGTSASPSFHNKVDHIEAVRIEFLPRAISLEEILSLTCEYATRFGIIEPPTFFYCDQSEQECINEWRDAVRFAIGIADDVHSEPATTFHSAEGYHQRYLSHLRGEFVANFD